MCIAVLSFDSLSPVMMLITVMLNSLNETTGFPGFLSQPVRKAVVRFSLLFLVVTMYETPRSLFIRTGLLQIYMCGGALNKSSSLEANTKVLVMGAYLRVRYSPSALFITKPNEFSFPSRVLRCNY